MDSRRLPKSLPPLLESPTEPLFRYAVVASRIDRNETTMTDHAALAAIIDAAFEERAKFSPGNAPADVVAAVEAAIDLLDSGEARVAEKVRLGLGRAPVAQEGGAAVVPPERQPRDRRRLHALLRQGRAQVRRTGGRAIPCRRRARRAAGRRAPRRIRREERGADAELRQHRRERRRGHDGRHLGHGRLLRADRTQRAPLGRRRHRRRARAAAGQPDDHRGQLLHRRALRGRRGRDRRGRRGACRWACSSARARASTTGSATR